MKRIILSSALILLVFAIFACGEDDSTGPSSPSAITMPFAIGNQWIYRNIEGLRAGGSSADTSTIVGTEVFKGQTYWVWEEADPDDDTVLMRQDGQDFYVVIEFGSSPVALRGDPGEDWLDRAFNDSQPWKFGQFDAETGTEWAIAAADTTFDVGGTQTPISLTVTGSSLGRQMVVVPAGSFDDSYHGRVIMEMRIDGVVEQRSTQDVWMKDGVGLVRMSDTSEGDNPESTNSELVSFSLN